MCPASVFQLQVGALKEELPDLLGDSWVCSQMPVSYALLHPVHPFKLALIKLIPLIPSSCWHCSESFGQKRVWVAAFLHRIILMPIETINCIWNTAKMRHSIMLWGCACRYTHSELTFVCSPLLFDLLACCYPSFFLCAFQYSAIPHRGSFSPKPH